MQGEETPSAPLRRITTPSGVRGPSPEDHDGRPKSRAAAGRKPTVSSSGRKTPVGIALGQRPASSDSAASMNTNPAVNKLSQSVSSVTDTSIAAKLPLSDEDIKPLYISSKSQLDDMCHNMLSDFEGKEAESNWPRRVKNILTLRQVTKANAPNDYPVQYTANIKLLLEGILKCANSLRTTFSTTSCQLVQEVARAVGHLLDPMVEILMQNFIKMCGNTKNIAAQNGNTTIDVLISHVSYSKHIVQHIYNACQDKNVSPREFAHGWMKTLLEVHGQRKSVFEHAGGMDVVEKCFKRGLIDANPKARGEAREAFWKFYALWPARGQHLVASMDEGRIKKDLQEHPQNPDREAPTSSAPAAGRAPVAPGGKSLTSRPSIKDIMAQKKREKAVMQRPQSALAKYSSTGEAPSVKPSAVGRSPPTQTSTGQGTGPLSSAPVRQGQGPRRPLVRAASRPDGFGATADIEVHLPERPKTPFRSGAPAKQAEPKRPVEGPRRPQTAPKAQANKAMTGKKQVTPATSTASSPEKLRTSPQSHPMKSVSDDASSVESSTARSADPSDTAMQIHNDDNTPRFIDQPDDDDDTIIRTEPDTPTLTTPQQQMPSTGRNFTPPSAAQENAPSTPRHFSSKDKGREDSILRTLTPRQVLAPPLGGGDATVTLSGEAFSPVKLSRPLMELHHNEVTNTPNGMPSPKRDPRAQKLIDSGIAHLKEGRLDPHGYRRLADAVSQTLETISPPKFGQLLSAVTSASDTRAEASEDRNANNTPTENERVTIQRLNMLSILSKSPLVQAHLSTVLRSIVLILHASRTESHTYWVAEGIMRELAKDRCASPNKVCEDMLDGPGHLGPITLKCVALLLQNKRFDMGDEAIVNRVADIAGRSVGRDVLDVDTRIQGYELAKALGPEVLRGMEGRDGGERAFLLYQSMRAAS